MVALIIPALVLLGLAPIVALAHRKLGYTVCAAGSTLFLVHGVEVYTSTLGLFYIATGLVWVFSSAYSHFYDHHRWLAPLYATSILGMALALTTNNLLVFLAGYETMTIPAYVIIGLYKNTDYPAFVFMAFGELSTVLILVGFLYSYVLTGSLVFSTLGVAGPFILAALGFMVKMGVLPFMVTEWLPIAHGNAPSNVSAILSASMTLVAAYGIVKMALLSPHPDYFGLILLGVGAFSVFFGAFYAYVSEHAKALLGFSTIENNGAILASVGVFLTAPTLPLARFALITASVYVLAHSLAKTGLFLTTGMMEDVSLVKPSLAKNWFSTTGGIILAASMSGLLPTLGGLATWALLETLFMEAYTLHSTLSVIPIIGGSIIAMGEGFATSTMLKFIVFTHVFNKQTTAEKSRPIIILVLGIVVLAFGSLGYLFYTPFLASNPGLGLPFGLIASTFSDEPFGAISPLYVFVLPLIIGALILVVVGRPRIRRVEVWNSGRPINEGYTSFAYSNNIRLMLRKLLLTQVDTNHVSVVDVFWSFTHVLARLYLGFSKRFARAYMNSKLWWYVVYMILALLVFTVVVLA
ncbi:MAG: proton-conducting transporter membrane subunit [Thermoprotei archaeon]